MFLWWSGVWPITGRTPKGALGGTFMHHVLVFNKRHDRQRREASYSGMTSGSLEPWNNWNWNISRFPALFFIFVSLSSPPHFSLSFFVLHNPPQTVHFLASSCFVLSTISSLITPGIVHHNLNFWQVSALLTLIYFSPLAVFAVAAYFLANVQYVGVKWTQEARNVGVFVFSYVEGITWGQILLDFSVIVCRQKKMQIKHNSALT